mmetsp:Transcript_62485/g.140906  ORF Transcript_62485/g.140906 Transcript_62485/m.140906 type:complete len:166 (-) Transcript_62485:159-656(-)
MLCEQLPVLDGFVGGGDLEVPPRELSYRLQRLERMELEELALELFLALKQSDARLCDLRRSARQLQPGPESQVPGMRRAKSGETMSGSGRLHATQPARTGVGLPRGKSGPVGHCGVSGGRLPGTGLRGAEDAAEQQAEIDRAHEELRAIQAAREQLHLTQARHAA